MIQKPNLQDQTALSRQWRLDVRRLASWLPAASMLAVLFVVAVALLWPAPFTHRVLPAGAPYTDLMTSHWPTALLIQRAEAQGHRLPLWNPYFAGGQPLVADPLAAVFYPPTQLAAVLPLRAYYLVLLTGHLMLAGLGMLLLARRAFGLPHLPSLVAAVSYMATPRLISHLGAGHVTIVQTVAWMPWLALACWATVREPRRWGALLGLCIALTLLAGHPQMAYYALLMTAAIAAWLLVRRWRAEGPRAALQSAAGLGIAAVAGVLVASIHLVPLMEFTAHSTREASVASTDSYPPPPFLLAIFGFEQPSTIPWETMLYPGLAVLLLAALGIVRRWRQGLPLLLGIALVAALAMGYASPVYRLVAHVLPDFDRFRAPARIWFVALVGFAVLAGLGSAELLQVVRRLSPLRVAAACGLLMVLIVAGSLIYTDQGYARVVDVSAATVPSALAQTSARLAGSGSIYGLQHNVTQLNAVELGARLADGWDPLLLDNYVTYMQRASGYSYSGYQLGVPAYSLDDPDHLDTTRVHLNARLLGLMNVSLVLSRTPLTDQGLVQVSEVDGTRIYRNTLDAGPGYLVQPDTHGRLPTLDQIQRVAVAVRADTQTPGREAFTFTAPSDGYFVVAMPYFPGWTATLDGHPVSIQPISRVLPAMRVGPGTHQLVYEYAPRSVALGAALSLAGLLAILVWLIVGFGRLRWSRPRSSVSVRE